LLVAFIPGLLMLATVGLARLESGLDRDTVTATDVATFLEQAKSPDVATFLEQAKSDDVHRRVHDRDAARAKNGHADQHRLPTRLYVHHQVNPEFQPTRHADRV
jgi:hypothetical protein